MKHTIPADIPHQTPTKVTTPSLGLQEQIRLRAYELYEQRGTEGGEVDDWLQAESEVTHQQAKTIIAWTSLEGTKAPQDLSESWGAVRPKSVAAMCRSLLLKSAYLHRPDPLSEE
jgi:hypothetical protein